MFDDLAIVIEPKDVDARPIAASRPLLRAVQDDEMIVGQTTRVRASVVSKN